MSGPIAPFLDRYRRALDDARLRTNLLNFQRSWRQTRQTALSHLEDVSTNFEATRAELVLAKNAILDDPRPFQRQFVERATAAGAHVYEVATAEQAQQLIRRLLQERNVQLLAKGKSMVAEEIFLNHHLEQGGIRVVETDLGEWIIQLAHETPSHMVMPAIHKSRGQVADLLESETHEAVDHQDIGSMVKLARRELRRVFLAADAGLIGANALITETGSVMLVTNEGNGDLVSTLPRVLIVLAGWDKLLPTLADAARQIRMLGRSATSQEITTYTSFITGAEQGNELHIVLVDNGRSAMYADRDFQDALRCIRCAACADICPPYQVVGGHVFGYVYSGAIGLANTPFHHGADAAAGPQALCVSCNACATVCPVGIPLPRQILDVRARIVAERGLPPAKRAVLELFQHPRLFDLAARGAAAVPSSLVATLPVPKRWAWRTPPRLAARPARDSLFGRTFEPLRDGPWVNSGD